MFFNAAIFVSVLAVVGFVIAAPTGLQHGDGTFYATGLGACGKVNVDTDMIAAVSHQFFNSFPGAGANPNNNPICGRAATVHHGSKTIKVQITDRCGGCKGATDLDFSPSAFNKLADPSVGRIPITWTLD
uniref:Loosenin n=1 Tax=Bjerkandera adusta TaxID=5331 RepID=D8WUM3_9APHY|nr:loosenin [Bjerkandera adusta]